MRLAWTEPRTTGSAELVAAMATPPAPPSGPELTAMLTRSVNPPGRSVLSCAIEAGNTAIVTAILDRNFTELNEEALNAPLDSHTLLDLAVYHGRADIVEKLLATNKMRVNVVTGRAPDQMTPLMLAAKRLREDPRQTPPVVAPVIPGLAVVDRKRVFELLAKKVVAADPDNKYTTDLSKFTGTGATRQDALSSLIAAHNAAPAGPAGDNARVDARNSMNLLLSDPTTRGRWAVIIPEGTPGSHFGSVPAGHPLRALLTEGQTAQTPKGEAWNRCGVDTDIGTPVAATAAKQDLIRAIATGAELTGDLAPGRPLPLPAIPTGPKFTAQLDEIGYPTKRTPLTCAVEAAARASRAVPVVPADVDRARGYVTALLTAGADPNKKDHDGHTPLDIAIEAGDSATVTAILAAAPKPMLVNVQTGTNTAAKEPMQPLARAAMKLIEDGTNLTNWTKRRDLFLALVNCKKLKVPSANPQDWNNDTTTKLSMKLKASDADNLENDVLGKLLNAFKLAGSDDKRRVLQDCILALIGPAAKADKRWPKVTAAHVALVTTAAGFPPGVQPAPPAPAVDAATINIGSLIPHAKTDQELPGTVTPAGPP